MRACSGTLGWAGIVRLGLAQFSLGALAVLATSTLNRIMVVELALPAIVPGLLVGLHYALQVARPGFGYASDRSAHRGRWIIGGMALLGGGTWLAALAAALMVDHQVAGLTLAVLAYGVVGAGVAATGTSVLALLARTVAPERRPAAATIVWVMMIAGSAVTAGAAGALLQPFSFARLVIVVGGVAVASCGVTALAVWRVEPAGAAALAAEAARKNFGAALRDVWSDASSRRFAVFVFVSMLAYSAQELVLEPFAALVFGLAPGASTRLVGLQHGGVMAGMVLVAVAGSAIGGRRLGSMRLWTVGGCLASALALLVLIACGAGGQATALPVCVFFLGLANGVFAVSAIGAMMQLAGGHRQGAGTSMGVFGAAQAIAFGCGGVLGSGASDLGRHLLGSPMAAYGCVFAAEAMLFGFAAVLATRIFAAAPRHRAVAPGGPAALGSPT